MGRLDRLRDRVTSNDDPLDPPPSKRDERSRLERLKSKVRADAGAASRAADNVKREVATRARADARRARRAATPQNAAAVARRAAATAAQAELAAGGQRESREQAVARRAQEAATAGPMLEATLAPTAPPQATESLLRGQPAEQDAQTELLRFGGAMDDVDSAGWYGGSLVDSGDGDNVDEGEALAWGEAADGDPMAFDTDMFGGGR